MSIGVQDLERLDPQDVVVLTGKPWRSLLDDLVLRERDAMGGLGPVERDWIVHRRSPERVRKLLLKAGIHPGIQNVNGPYAGPEGNPAAPPTSFTPVATTNVETNLWTPAIWTPIPANTMQAGKVYSVKGGGVLGTSSAAPTAVWTPRVGQSATPSSNITMGATTGTTYIASLAAVPWYHEFNMTIRALGLAASGATGTGNGFIVVGGLTTAAGIIQSMGATIASTIDNTAAVGMILSLTWNNNSANNTATCQWVFAARSYN